jgi:nucleotide-binding universal stress UspA family protein
LAKKRRLDLIFLYVVDASFAGAMDEAMAVTLTDELRRLGRCLLQIAEKRALKRGVPVQLVIREGKVQPSIEALIRETGASALVIGSPRTGPEPQVFDRRQLGDFAASIQRTTGAEVLVVE